MHQMLKQDLYVPCQAHNDEYMESMEERWSMGEYMEV